MEKEYRILIVEDLSSDAKLAGLEIGSVLKNYEIKVIETEEDFIQSLQVFDPHLIISDLYLPSFDALSVLKIVQEKSPNIPVIILTGSMDEATAVDCMKAGATDYIIKQHLKRLGQAVLNALEQSRIKLEKIETENELKKREEIYRFMFANNPQPMWIYDLETLAFLEVNQAAISHYGYSRKEFLSMTLKDIRPPEDIPALLKDVELTKRKYNPAGEWRHLKKNGELIYVEIVSHSITFNNSKARHVLVKDITAQKKAIEALKFSEEKYRTIFENVQDVFYQTNTEGVIIDVSPSVKYFYEFPREELIGKSISAIYSNTEEREALLKTISEKGEVRDYPLRIKTKSGVTKFISINAHLILDYEGKPHHIDGSIRNITERIDLFQKLFTAKEKAEESDRLKTAFLHNISHEIRTPLNAIIGFSGFLEQSELSPGERKEYLDIIFESNNQLLAIINDILIISTIEAGQVKIQELQFDLNEVMNNIYKNFKSDFKRKNLDYEMEIGNQGSGSIIISDENKLIHIISNLLSNALKFTHQGSVKFGYAVEDKFIEFFVEDTGIGISIEEQDRIFDSFYQIDNSISRVYGGTGLGLSISNAYIELLGGKIRIKSSLGKGTTFYFTIPYKKAVTDINKNLSNDFREEISSIRTKTILVAEDEENNFALFCAMLRPRGYEIVRAKNGLEAIEMCQSNPNISLVLMDIKMPVKDGFEATSEIKKIKPGLPVIAQTACAHSSDKARALECGCVDYIAKPFKRNELIELVEKYIS